MSFQQGIFVQVQVASGKWLHRKKREHFAMSGVVEFLMSRGFDGIDLDLDLVRNNLLHLQNKDCIHIAIFYIPGDFHFPKWAQKQWSNQDWIISCVGIRRNEIIRNNIRIWMFILNF